MVSTMDKEESRAFEELAKLTISDDTVGGNVDTEATENSSLDKENINIVFIGHVGKKLLRCCPAYFFLNIRNSCRCW